MEGRKKKERGTDGFLIFLVLLLVVCGLIFLYSTSAYNGRVKFHDSAYYFKKQFIVFVREYTIYFMVFVVTVAFSVVIECFIQESFVGLLCCGTISVVVSLLVFTLVFHKREEYAYYVSLLKTQLMNRLKQRG